MHHLLHGDTVNSGSIDEEWRIPDDQRPLLGFRLRFAELLMTS